jgi:hypothetical protein
MRLGKPWIGYCIIVVVIGAFAEVAYFVIRLLEVGPNKYGGLPWVNGLFASVMAVVDLAALLLVFRHPSRLNRVIKLTDSELQLPDPKWRHVPLSDVAGMGLAKFQGVLGSKAKGTWMPIFWQRDGSHLRVGGFGLATSKDPSEQTKVTDNIREIYRRISAAQGPDGLLATQALQRSANLRVTDSIVDIWDPSSTSSARSAT